MSKWHDLRKDKADLPIKRNSIVSVTVLDQYGDRCWYNYKDHQWEDGNPRTDGTYDCKVIAWCEVPTFETDGDELKRFIALWENAVCEIRAENKASESNARIAHLCDKLESSMVAYAKGDVEYAHFAI